MTPARSRLLAALVALLALGAGLGTAALGAAGVLDARGSGDAPFASASASSSAWTASATAAPTTAPTTAATQPPETLRPRRQPRHQQHHPAPLAGKVVVIDPGHQLGNGAHPSEINRPVDAGGFDKPCNTTGTSTNDGYPEATFAWEVALRLREELEALGATVELTRNSNSEDAWGPCVDARGRAGNPGEPGPTADVKLSIHGDGTYTAGAHGFHVIAPGDLPGYTDDIEADSLDLAHVVRDALVHGGFAVSTYTGTDGIDVRTDLGTLNLADMPTVMVELGNMRDAGDAAEMESSSGQDAYADALAAGISAYLR
ncbi:N-acetylmuramoyl-L-alanine amidase [Nocardioides panacisoli]|uniref:N-acetylmuramoyl-L-alanine amidase n=1 Tax=Nocardioides panacisoli TaxID=627624 RepID=A0ABP7IX23_9ACTN